MADALPDMLHVDSHVHLHPSFDDGAFLDAALANFQKATAKLGVMVLTEKSADHAYDRLAQVGRCGAWSLVVKAGGEALQATRDDRAELAILPGRQVLTAERLEVLAIGGRPTVEDGLAFKKTVAAVRESGVGVVVPWGFGKWTGERAEAVRRLIDTRPQGVALGDNGGRPRVGIGDGLLRHAQQMGMTVLPGSDPLPIKSGITRAGSLGVVVPAPPTWDELPDTVRDLPDLGPNPATFGHHVGLIGGVMQQVMLRVGGGVQQVQPMEASG